jgi:CheY-like chemotaxis protein
VAAALALDKVRGLLQPMAAERGVTLEAPHGALGLRLLAQPRTLTQALFNLLANAIKYNREGGRVRCRIEPRGARQGAIVVCDDGPGVAEADRARLFEPFERLARGGPDAQGSGLGLAITRRLVEAMGGSVDASFPAEGGTCVSIVLPLVDAPATADRGDAEPAAQPLAPRRRALLVARDAADAAAWRALFAPRCDWTLATLPAGPPWADEVRRVRPHLLLLDLPASQDMELTLLRAELGAEAPLCIALLSDHAATTVVQALRVGFDEAWTRPVAPAALQRRLDALGRDAAARRERGGV